ncbi:hypothetical protein MUK42_31388, partial [Musa troglodytarum]
VGLVFCAPSQKLKILNISNLLGSGKLYNPGFVKKRDGHKVYVSLMFDRFFVHHLKNLKYWSFPTY